MGKAKKKRKRDRGGGDGRAARGDGGFAAGLASGIAGQAIGQLIADGIQRKAPTVFGGPDKGPDLTARVLITLSEQGAKSVAELVDALDAPLQTLLEALAAARRAKLITRVDKSGVVRVTEPGCRVADVVCRKLQKEGEASAEESTAAGDGGG